MTRFKFKSRNQSYLFLLLCKMCKIMFSGIASRFKFQNYFTDSFFTLKGNDELLLFRDHIGSFSKWLINLPKDFFLMRRFFWQWWSTQITPLLWRRMSPDIIFQLNIKDLRLVKIFVRNEMKLMKQNIQLSV